MLEVSTDGATGKRRFRHADAGQVRPVPSNRLRQALFCAPRRERRLYGPAAQAGGNHGCRHRCCPGRSWSSSSTGTAGVSSTDAENGNVASAGEDGGVRWYVPVAAAVGALLVVGLIAGFVVRARRRSKGTG